MPKGGKKNEIVLSPLEIVMTLTPIPEVDSASQEFEETASGQNSFFRFNRSSKLKASAEERLKPEQIDVQPVYTDDVI